MANKAESKILVEPLLLPLKKLGEIPVDRVLTDDQGRSLDATIVGRSADSVQIVRRSDGLNAEILISKLAVADREFVEGLEIKEPPTTFGQPKIPLEEKTDHYVKNRTDEIERLQEENKRLQAEADSTTNSMVARSRASSIRRNEVEIEKLKAAIRNYRSSR